MSLLRLVGMCLLLGAASAAAQNSSRQAFRPYVNARFGVSALVPAGWKAGPEPENGDGLSFTSPDGKATLAIYGSYGANPGSPADEIAFLARAGDGENVAYLKRGARSIAVSGTKGDRIFYRKSLLSCRDTVWNSIAFDYPAEQKATFDPIVARVAASLHGGANDCRN